MLWLSSCQETAGGAASSGGGKQASGAGAGQAVTAAMVYRVHCPFFETLFGPCWRSHRTKACRRPVLDVHCTCSRPVLDVHCPTTRCGGALQGGVLGSLAARQQALARLKYERDNEVE